MKKPEETLTKIRGHLKTLRLNGIEKALEKELSEAAQESACPDGTPRTAACPSRQTR